MNKCKFAQLIPHSARKIMNTPASSLTRSGGSVVFTKSQKIIKCYFSGESLGSGIVASQGCKSPHNTHRTHIGHRWLELPKSLGLAPSHFCLAKLHEIQDHNSQFTVIFFLKALRSTKLATLPVGTFWDHVATQHVCQATLA